MGYIIGYFILGFSLCAFALCASLPLLEDYKDKHKL